MKRIAIAALLSAGLTAGFFVPDARADQDIWSYSRLVASRNSGGTYTLPNGNPVITGTMISSTWANTTLADLATEMTNSLSRNGQGGMLAPLLLTNGTASLPSLAFTNSPTSGLYRAGADNICMSIAANSAYECWTSSAQTISNNLGLLGNQTISGTLGVTGITSLGALNTSSTTIHAGLVGFGNRTPTTYYLEAADSGLVGDSTIAQFGVTVPTYLGSSTGAGSISSFGWNLHPAAGPIVKFGGTGFGGIFAFAPSTGAWTYSATAVSGAAGGTATTTTLISQSSAASPGITYSEPVTITPAGGTALIISSGGAQITGQVSTGALTIGSGGNAITASYDGSTSWNPGSGSLSTQTATSTGITVTGAAVGNSCAVGVPAAANFCTGGTICMVSCVVDVPNLCTVFLYNVSTTVTANFNSATYSCRVFNP